MAILIMLGNGVVANVVLQQTKGHGSGWTPLWPTTNDANKPKAHDDQSANTCSSSR
jgi:hypothetical protein